MENASKALLLAAAILIAIILISLGVYIVNQGSDVIGQGGQALDEVGRAQFNSKFEVYKGTITGTQVKSLIKTVSSSNVSNPGQQVTISASGLVTSATSTVDGIEVTTYEATSAIGNSTRYTVTMSENGGVISTITITSTKS